jgi:hypothetical protein
MYVNISRHVRVFITEKQHLFIHKWQNQESFLQSELPIEEAVIAKTLSDKGILVRKKLDNDTQYALNKHIRFTIE